MKKAYRNIIFLIIALIILDQASKTFAISAWPIVQNFGIAFGLSIPFPVLIIGNILLLILLTYLASTELKLQKPLAQILTALVIAGGLSNLIDRVVYGYVVDFISIWIWPVFNLADVYVTVGVLALLLFYGKIKRS